MTSLTHSGCSRCNAVTNGDGVLSELGVGFGCGSMLWVPDCIRAAYSTLSTKNDAARVSKRSYRAATPATCFVARLIHQSPAEYPAQRLLEPLLQERLCDPARSLSSPCPVASSRRESAFPAAVDIQECKRPPVRFCRHLARSRSYRRRRPTLRKRPSRSPTSAQAFDRKCGAAPEPFFVTHVPRRSSRQPVAGSRETLPNQIVRDRFAMMSRSSSRSRNTPARKLQATTMISSPS